MTIRTMMTNAPTVVAKASFICATRSSLALIPKAAVMNAPVVAIGVNHHVNQPSASLPGKVNLYEPVWSIRRDVVLIVAGRR